MRVGPTGSILREKTVVMIYPYWDWRLLIFREGRS